ncbi:ComEA family DNA-binding protein [Arthrobacter sp. LAPM80]|uniref:helix-hairpin-helix domain-containing protein n=1 Tax=Arthrobacter sp. LAPM80 TaxID=3141788 RepID=UPI00398B7701
MRGNSGGGDNGRDPTGRWSRPGGTSPPDGRPCRRGPRWVISLRALVVVLAMISAALGVLWIESAGVQGASAELSTEVGRKLVVPPVGDTGGSAEQATAGKTPASRPSAAPAPAAAPATPMPGIRVVHVAGAVKNPGVFPLPPGSRVYQALDAAGGALPGAALDALNLAAPLADGTQILVPTAEEAAAAAARQGTGHPPEGGQGPSAPAGAASRNGLLNVNTATAAEFDTLPGVGPVLAGRIVAWRTDHGPFTSVEGLTAVTGIGPKLLAGLRDLVTVS